MSEPKTNIVDFPKYYHVDSEGFICFVNDNGERTRIARILKSGDLEAVGKTKISDPTAKKKRHFWVKTFIFLFFLLAACSSGTVYYLYEKSAKLNEEYQALTERYGNAVSEVVLVCKSELKKIEDFINDSEEHNEEEIEELIKKLRGISPDYCQSDSELYPKFAELSKALYVMKGKIGGKREAEERQKKELEQQQELERQRELERQKELERQQELERELAEMKRREAEQKKLEDERKKAEQEKREKEEKEKRKIEEKNKTKNADAVKKSNNSNKKKVDNTKKKPQPESVKNTKNDKPNTKIVKEDKAKEKPKPQEKEDEEVSKLKQGIDKLEEWLKSLKR